MVGWAVGVVNCRCGGVFFCGGGVVCWQYGVAVPRAVVCSLKVKRQSLLRSYSYMLIFTQFSLLSGHVSLEGV